MTKSKSTSGRFHIEFLNASQKMAWALFQQHDVLFLIGPAGTGKTFLATAFAISEILQKSRKKIVLTRPIVEAGESLGFLPGDMAEKVNPYMLPIFDCLHELVPNEEQRKIVESAIELAPIAFMRGRNFKNAICMFDEAQNATKKQLKLFLTRFSNNSKIIITGDPTQSDIGVNSGLMDVIHRLESVPGVGVISFGKESIVRHPMVSAMLDKLED
jgi:phosphate starvation-inducible PhoH-like protein